MNRSEFLWWVGRIRDIRRLVCAALILASLPGCLGYATYRSQFPSEMRQMGVAVFGNETLYTGLEFDLTRAVQEEMTRRIGAPLVAEGDARVMLSGRLVEFSPREALTVGRGDIVIDRQAVAAAAVLLKNADGKVLYENPRISASVTYRPAAGQGEAKAYRDVLTELARRIALAILDRW